MKTEFCDQGPPQFVVAGCSNIHENTLEPYCGRRLPQIPTEGGNYVSWRTKVDFSERYVQWSSVIQFHLFLLPGADQHLIDLLLQASFKTTLVIYKCLLRHCDYMVASSKRRARGDILLFRWHLRYDWRFRRTHNRDLPSEQRIPENSLPNTPQKDAEQCH